ncbi:uncharacterized protein LOC125314450 [Rhodamnia argentea]|uniref:Uncharacterized protein LOC125314450 n=1 Tax=Rhodamnia argentea TaxID=178133 RepID=A0ABM3H7Z7_9MYRT|nr:uncharacterized protein LOC125314450 [Rhodamnia argentea]
MILPVVAVVSSGIVAKKMKATQVFSSHFKEVWEEWELRGVVFLSLTLQILLICMGNRRKYIRFSWFWGLIWLAYLMADPVAIYALGIITNKLTKINGHSVDANTELNAFWAPFLLLHLGGPDTITAYALEDNELWLRHSLSLVTQTGVTFYIFLMAWTGPNISILAIVIILAGFVKYGERVYVLWAASSEQFRDSIPDPPPNYSKIVEQHKLMKAEGYSVTPHEVIEVSDMIMENNVNGADLFSPEENPDQKQIYKHRQGELLAARGLVNIFQRLFADLLLSFEDRDTSLSLLKDKNFRTAFAIIEIELGIMYDLLYTKAKAIHTRWGFARRIFGLVSTCIVLILFSEIEDQQYSTADLYMTFILLAVAIFLEIYALAVLLFSDRTACWLIKRKKLTILDLINWLRPLTKRRRWSDHMAQFSLLSFAFKEKHLPCHRILECLHIDEIVEKPLYKHHKKVTDDMKKLIVNHIKEMQSPCAAKATWDVNKSEHKEHLQWTMELEFDQTILIWHIATELLYGLENDKNLHHKAKPGKYLSRYMLYILVMHPEMLPTGIGRIKFRETYIEAMKFFDGLKSFKADEDPDDEASSFDNEEDIGGYRKYAKRCAGFCTSAWQHIKKRKKRKLDITSAFNQLQEQVNTELDLLVARGEKSKYVLFHGCRLAWQLRQIENGIMEGDIVGETWVKILCDAAIKCKAKYHAQQLRRGGELLTHVWLMMAHFGLTDHYQIAHAPAIAELIVH